MMRILALGDMLLDIVPQRYPVPSADVPHTATRVGIGGRAAAVAAWVSSLGGEAGLIGARGDDVVARMAAAELYRRGVRMHGPVVRGEAGTVARLIGESGVPSVAASPSLTAADLDPSWFVGADVLHISGHGLLTGPTAEFAAAAAEMARPAGVRISVDLPGAEMIRYWGPESVAGRLLRLRPRILFGAEDALDALGVRPSVPLVVVTRADGGVQVRRRGQVREIPAPDVVTVDSTGVNDAFVAGFLLGADLDDSIDRARRAAAMCRGCSGQLPAIREGVASASSSVP